MNKILVGFILVLGIINCTGCKKEFINENLTGKWAINPGSEPFSKESCIKAPCWLGGDYSEIEFFADGRFKSNVCTGKFKIEGESLKFFVDSNSQCVVDISICPGGGIDELSPDLSEGKSFTLRKFKSKKIILRGEKKSGFSGVSDGSEGAFFRYKRID